LQKQSNDQHNCNQLHFILLFFIKQKSPVDLRPGFALPLHNCLCKDTIRSLMNKIKYRTMGHTIPVWLQ
jgi:hypothetical protein